MKREEEYALIELTKTGDVAATEKLFHQFRPMLWKFALKTYCRWLEKEDLFQVACVAFLEGLKLFDFVHKVRLSTFLYRHVPWHLQRAAQQAGLVRVPPGSFLLQPEKAKASNRIGQLDELNSPHSTDVSLMDLSRLVGKLRAEIKKLPENWQVVINRRMQDKTLEEIGVELKVSKQRIAQIEAKAHDRLVRSGIGRLVV